MIAFDALLALARQAGRLTEGEASGGSATTIVDNAILGILEWETDDALNGGTAFIITAGSAAPENETARITDYDESTYTVTVASGDLSAAAAASDIYAVTAVPRYRLYQAVNAALRDIGFVVFEDDTSLDTAASTIEYDLPAAARRDLRQVWIAGKTSAPYEFSESHDWRVVPYKTTGNLVFHSQPRSSRDIRLIYCGPHDILSADADSINELVHADWLTWRSAYHYYRRLLHETGKEDDRYVALMNEAAENAHQLRQRHRMELPKKTTRWYNWPEPDVGQPRGATIDTGEVAH